MSKSAVIEGRSFSPLLPVSRRISVPVTDTIKRLMDISFEQAEMAMADGNTPVGAVLIDLDSGREFYAGTTDKMSRNIEDHAEKRTYKQAQPAVLDKLSECALVSTLELCAMCTTTFEQGDIGTIICALPRAEQIRQDGTPILRPRKIGRYSLPENSNGHTNAYMGYRAEESLALWQEWDRRRESALAAQ